MPIGTNGHPIIPIEQRFWKHVKKTNGCWNWIGAAKTDGYGIIMEGKRGSTRLAAHRVAYEIHNGPIPKGLLVCHKCDHPLCVNPKHLFLGTLEDNVADRVKKGRSSQGINHPKAKLTPAIVRRIRKLYKPRISHYSTFAKQYKLSGNAIKAMINRKTWKHVND